MLDLPVAAREQSNIARRPPVPMRKSSFISSSDRVSSASGAAGLQGALQSCRRPSASRGSVDEGAVGTCCRTAHRAVLSFLCINPSLSSSTSTLPTCGGRYMHRQTQLAGKRGSKLRSVHIECCCQAFDASRAHHSGAERRLASHRD
jgi:hypothetical protein